MGHHGAVTYHCAATLGDQYNVWAQCSQIPLWSHAGKTLGCMDTVQSDSTVQPRWETSIMYGHSVVSYHCAAMLVDHWNGQSTRQSVTTVQPWSENIRMDQAQCGHLPLWCTNIWWPFPWMGHSVVRAHCAAKLVDRSYGQDTVQSVTTVQSRWETICMSGHSVVSFNCAATLANKLYGWVTVQSDTTVHPRWENIRMHGHSAVRFHCAATLGDQYNVLAQCGQMSMCSHAGKTLGCMDTVQSDSTVQPSWETSIMYGHSVVRYHCAAKLGKH